MTDSPSSILLLRLQSVGSNTNLWGGYLNTALQTLERASKGYQALAVTGSATISWANYSAANDGAVAFLKLTGSLSAAATLTFPSYNHFLNVWNATGAAVTIKCSGGTGVAVPNGMRTLIFCDGTDYYSAASTWLSTYQSTLTNNGDAVVKQTLEQAIANASLPAAAGTILVSAADATAGYAGTKLSVTGTAPVTVTPSTTSPGVNEVRVWAITIPDGALIDGGLVTASFSPAVGTKYRIPIGGTVTMPTPTGSGRKIELALYGFGTTFLSGLVNGLALWPVDGDQTITLTDADATRGWV